MNPRRTREQAEHLEALCRDHGLPVTVQRRVVLDAILKNDSHPTADELYEHARGTLPGISRTTVYRILEAFIGLGLVARVPHPRGACRFDGCVEPHHHAICTECERVFDVQEPPCSGLAKPKALPKGFRLSSCTILFTGTCASCSAPVRN